MTLQELQKMTVVKLRQEAMQHGGISGVSSMSKGPIDRGDGRAVGHRRQDPGTGGHGEDFGRQDGPQKGDPFAEGRARRVFVGRRYDQPEPRPDGHQAAQTRPAAPGRGSSSRHGVGGSDRRQNVGEHKMKTPVKKRNKTARLKAKLKAKLRRARLRVSKGERKYSR